MTQQPNLPVEVEKGPSFVRRHGGKMLMVLGGVIVLFVVMQLIPIDRTNPPVKAEPNWDSQQTRDLVANSCFDCHSNQTDWSPWYTKVAPAKFLVWRDVQEGRDRLNFSEWSGNNAEAASEIAEVVDSGEMPPMQYTLMHPNAKLSDSEKQQLIDGMARTLGQSNSTTTSAVPSDGDEDND